MPPRRPDSLAAEAAFRTRLADLGATLIEPEWLGAQARHRVTCREGHPCTPRPASVQQGQGICKACAGQCPDTARAAFDARLAEFGASLIGAYVNNKTQVHVRCAAGHDVRATPAAMRLSAHICQMCSGRAPALAALKFAGRIAELGAESLEPYVNVTTPVLVRCAAGHESRSRPGDILQGHGLCKICASKSPVAARAEFVRRLAKVGAELLETEWHGVGVPHRIRCAQGHIGSPRPTHVLRGGGPCKFCTHNGDWDTFYVVTSDSAVKFGITTGDPRPRLRAHARDGLTEIVRLAGGLTEGAALEAEREVRAALTLAGEKPLRGREYYPATCLALVLDVADSWLGAEVAA